MINRLLVEKLLALIIFLFLPIDLERQQSSFLVSLSENVVIPSYTPIPFDVVNFDAGNNYNSSTYTYVVPVSGTYLFYARMACFNYTSNCDSSLYVDEITIAASNEAVPFTGNTVGWSNLVISHEVQKGENIQYRTINGNSVFGSQEIRTYFGGYFLF